MSKKCPFCNSYNTEVSVVNYAGRAILQGGRFVLAAGAGMVAHLFSPSSSHGVAHSVLHNTEPGEFKGYRCCNCGKEFSA